MNLYKTAMILRYGKYNLADLKQEVIKDRIVLSSTYFLSLLLFLKTHDPNLLSLLSLSTYGFCNSFSDMKKYSADYFKLCHLYNTLITNYSKSINNVLELKNVPEISEAFMYSYKNGFLSSDNSFTYKTSDIFDVSDNLGSTVTTGRGCCRHISTMLSDVLMEENINSICISSFFNQLKDIYKFANSFDEESLNKLIDDIISEDGLDIYEKVDKIYDLTNNAVIEHSKEWKYNQKHSKCNHLISLAEKDDKAYYIDPTSFEYYCFNKDEKALLNKDKTIKNSIFLSSSSKYEKKAQNRILSLPDADLNDVLKEAKRTKRICSDNIDVFVKFYKENHELIDEISKKVKLVGNYTK